MGTTAEKLKYLNETKAEIKNALETPYNVMRDYPELIKKYIDNQPTKVVTDGICGNAVDVPVKTIETNGNIRQETTDGRQLFDNTLKGYGHYGAIAKTIPTGVRLSANADTTASDYTFGLYATINLSNFVGKTVRMKAMFKSNSNLKGTYSIGLCSSNGISRVPKGSTGVSEKEISFVIPSLETGQEYLGVWFYTNSGGTGVAGDYVDYTNVIITIDNEDMTYEPYTGGTPSPNPNYPQDIEVVDGYNRFDETEILKAEGWTKNSDGYYNGSFLKWNNAFDTKTSGFTIKGGFRVNTQYILSFKGYVSGGTASFRIKYDDETFSNYLFSNTSEELHTIVSTAGKNVVGLYGTYTSGGGNTLYIKDVQFIEGTALKPYLPYGSIGLKQSGKNKFDNFKEYSYSNSNLNATSLNNGIKIEKKGGFGLWVFDNLENLDGKIVRAKSKFNDGGSIAIGLASLDGTSRTIMKENTKSDTVSSFVIPKITDDKKYLAVWLYGSDNSEIYYEDLIVTIDNEDMTYEPYHEPKVISINLQGNTLAKVGDIKGILRVNRNGEIEIKKNIEKIVLTGSEKLVDKSSSTTRTYWAINFSNYGIYQYDDSTKTCDILTTKFKSRPQRGSFLPGQVALMEDSKKVYFIFEPDTTEEQARAILTDMPVYFRLAEPQTIKLSSISPIELWKGTNIFELITNLETNFEVEYVVDKDSMLDEVQTAMLEAEI